MGRPLVLSHGAPLWLHDGVATLLEVAAGTKLEIDHEEHLTGHRSRSLLNAASYEAGMLAKGLIGVHSP